MEGERYGCRVSIGCYSLWAFGLVEVDCIDPEEVAAAVVEGVDCRTVEEVGYFDIHTAGEVECCSFHCMMARAKAGRNHHILAAVVEEGHNRAVVEEQRNFAEEGEDRSFEEGRRTVAAAAGRDIVVLDSKTWW